MFINLAADVMTPTNSFLCDREHLFARSRSNVAAALTGCGGGGGGRTSQFTFPVAMGKGESGGSGGPPQVPAITNDTKQPANEQKRGLHPRTRSPLPAIVVSRAVLHPVLLLNRSLFVCFRCWFGGLVVWWFGGLVVLRRRKPKSKEL